MNLISFFIYTFKWDLSSYPKISPYMTRVLETKLMVRTLSITYLLLQATSFPVYIFLLNFSL